MKGESKEQALRNNLRDAGCGGKTVEQFLALEAEGKREAQLRLLFAHRQLLLRRLHREEQRIGLSGLSPLQDAQRGGENARLIQEAFL